MEIIRNTPIPPSKSSSSDFSDDEPNLLESTSVKSLKITDLKSALRDENRVNVFVNDKFAFSLDLSQVVDLKVKIGKTLTESELETLRQESEFGKLYQRAIEWILTRPHSIKETKDYLKRCQVKRAAENRRRESNRQKPKEERQKWHLKTKILPEITNLAIDRVFDQLLNRGYLNDQKFATYFVENRQTKKGISRRRLEQELRKKGIDQQTISATLENSPRNDSEELKKLIQKKRPRYPDDQKLIAYLVRQGFSYDLVKSVLQNQE